eukprot:CAMPEP_0197483834 /NCGR_PEP_ID=MMETSP1309-20131121/57095_1 /TAXON_ID=464262 /ORGANISM="Genus nov. species nov., Strain RCC998" /LENGTH=237 /DNA_ID=CAMNT_0043026459 /DNA_START=210 /DNA_END=924 /DNA_ORIENTATION=-
MVASTEANSVHAESMRELACAMQKQMKEEPEAPELTSDCRIGVKPQPSRKEAVVIKRETADSTLCPVTTTSSTRPFTTRDESLELRAYKLGKGKCSYNMVQVDFLKGLKTDEALSVVEANEMSQKHLHQDLAESKVSYELRLDNKSKILLDVYVVYSSPASSKFMWANLVSTFCEEEMASAAAVQGRLREQRDNAGGFDAAQGAMHHQALAHDNAQTCETLRRPIQHKSFRIDEIGF